MIPFVTQKMSEIFESKVVSVPNAVTIIAEGAAVISCHNWLPSLVYPISVLLSDNTLYPIYPEGTVLYPEVTKKILTFFCTDPRDGEGRLIIAEGADGATIGRKTKAVIAVPVRALVIRNDIDSRTRPCRATYRLPS